VACRLILAALVSASQTMAAPFGPMPCRDARAFPATERNMAVF
jgi:hypothetical protein